MCWLRRCSKGDAEGEPGRAQEHGKDSEKARAPFWRRAVQQMHKAAYHGKGSQYGVQRCITMMEVGRLCLKTAGRDAGKRCVVIDTIDKNHVLVDGETRRRKCNILHLEPIDKVIEISQKADHEAVVEALKKIGIEAAVKKSLKEETPKPKNARKKAEPKDKAASK